MNITNELSTCKIFSYNNYNNKFESFYTQSTNYNINYKINETTKTKNNTIGIFSFINIKNCVDHIDVFGGIFDDTTNIIFSSNDIPVGCILNIIAINISNKKQLILNDNCINNNLLDSYYEKNIHNINYLNTNDEIYDIFDKYNVISNRQFIISESIYIPYDLNKKTIDTLNGLYNS